MTTITETRVLARIDKWSVVILDRFACIAAVDLVFDESKAVFKTKATGNRGEGRGYEKTQ